MSENTNVEAWIQSGNNSGNDADESETDDAGKTNPSMKPNETTDYYLGLGDLKAVVTALIKTRPDLSTNFTGDESELDPQVVWLKRIHQKKSAIGERQREHNDFGIGINWTDEGAELATGGYAATFGSLPSIEWETVPGGVMGTLKKVAKASDYDGFELSDYKRLGFDGDPKVPVTSEGALPILVGDDDELEEATRLLSLIPDQPKVAGEVEGEYGTIDPANYTLDELKTWFENNGPLTAKALAKMRKKEQAGKDRNGAADIFERELKRAVPADDNDAQESDDAASEEAQDDDGDDEQDVSAAKMRLITTLMENEGVSFEEAQKMASMV